MRCACLGSGVGVGNIGFKVWGFGFEGSKVLEFDVLGTYPGPRTSIHSGAVAAARLRICPGLNVRVEHQFATAQNSFHMPQHVGVWKTSCL